MSSSRSGKKDSQTERSEQNPRVIPLRAPKDGQQANENLSAAQNKSFVLARFFLWFIGLWRRASAHYLRAVAEGRLSLVPSAMMARLSLPVRLLFLGYRRKISPTDKQVASIVEMTEKGSVVYMMYCRSTLDYLYVNHLFLKAGLPQAHFANGIDLAVWLPFLQKLQVFMARFFHALERIRIRKDAPAGTADISLRQYFEKQQALPIFDQLVREKKPILLFLTRSRALFSPEFGFAQNYLLELIHLQRKVEHPIFLVPQILIWEKRPERLQERSVFQVVFGDPDTPGYVRKIVHFLRYYRFAQVKFGQAINLQEFLSTQDRNRSPEEEARKIRYVLRHFLYREKKVMSGPQERSRAKVMTRVCRHKDVEQAIKEYSLRTGKTIEEGRVLALKYADEMVADRRWGMIVFLDKALHFIFRAFYRGVVINKVEMERLQQSIKDHPVVFVSNHRSHIDYLVLCWAFYRHHILVPYICAGINLNFWPMGMLFRRSGAYFIRRSYPEPDIYPIVLGRYIRELLSTGQGQLFFIEGGRSRTGKMLRPKMGVLSKVVEGFEAGVCKDVLFAPMYVGYDRILEEKSYLVEAASGEKAQEDLGGLLKFTRKIIRARYGKIYVSLDEPISLKKYLEENPEPKVLPKLASRLAYGINRVAVVFPTALVALILLSHRKRALSNLEVAERATPLLRYLERRKVQLSDVFYNREYAYDSALKFLSENRLLHVYPEAEASFYSIDESKRTLMNYYKNNIVHFFVTYSLLSVCILNEDRKVGEGRSIANEAVEKTYDYLLALLDGEFFFRPKEARPAHVADVLEFFKKEGALEIDAPSFRVTPEGRKFLAQQKEIVYNFLESYALVMLALKPLRGRLVEEKDFIRQVISLGRRYYAQGRLERLEALHRFTLQSAFTSLSSKGFLKKERESVAHPKREGAKAAWRVTESEAAFKTWLNPLLELVRQNFVDEIE